MRYGAARPRLTDDIIDPLRREPTTIQETTGEGCCEPGCGCTAPQATDAQRAPALRELVMAAAPAAETQNHRRMRNWLNHREQIFS